MPLPRSDDLGLSDEQRLLRRTVREFARTRRRPARPALDAAQSFPRESWQPGGRAGPARRLGPEPSYGGADLGLTELCLDRRRARRRPAVSTAATVLHQADMVVGRLARHAGDASRSGAGCRG